MGVTGEAWADLVGYEGAESLRSRYHDVRRTALLAHAEIGAIGVIGGFDFLTQC